MAQSNRGQLEFRILTGPWQAKKAQTMAWSCSLHRRRNRIRIRSSPDNN
jgi:hypothetical protein